MSRLPLHISPQDFDTPSRKLTGATRPSSNPRLHAVQRPYARPVSYQPPPSAGRFITKINGTGPYSGGGGVDDKRLLGQRASTSTSGMTRSGSESSLGLIGGLKSMLYKPLQWLATPSRQSKRDLGLDVEDVESPSSIASPSKRVRRRSPSPPSPFLDNNSNTGANGVQGLNAVSHGDYTPRKRDSLQVQRNRGEQGNMLPPLPPHVSLNARSTRVVDSRPEQSTSFSRPLHGARSMPYLDPPSMVLSPPKQQLQRKNLLARSRRLDLGVEEEQEEGEEDEDEDMGEEVKSRNEMNDWTPWNKRREKGVSPGRYPRQPPTPNRRAHPERDYALTSISPFKTLLSPSAPRHTPGASLSRANTIATASRAPRTGSVVSDLSMSGHESVKSHRRTGSLLFGLSGTQLNGEREERMSVDGERDGSGADWSTRNRWSTGLGQAGLTPGRAASLRHGSPSSLPPIRRGQMVWDSEKGFIRESELRATEAPKVVGSNEAERILFALENRRNTPLQAARSTVPFTQGGPLPAEFVGASARQLRKAINVPLATAHAGETARNRREKDLLEERQRGVSVLISPYGRRKQADDALRQSRREHRAASHDSEYQQRSERTASSVRSKSSRASDHDMLSGSDAEDVALPTPRRSSRLKRTSVTPEPEPTHQARRSTKGKGKGSIATAQTETSSSKDTPRRSNRKRTVDATSPLPRPVPTIPEIVQTAPSPSHDSTKSSGTYQPRAQGEMTRGSGLRAKSEVTKRTHVGAASLNTSRATSPSSGRFSAREEDLPSMDELDQPKIPFQSFSGITFSGLGSATAPLPSPASNEKDSAAEASTTPAFDGMGLLGRLGPAPPTKIEQSGALNVPSRAPAGPLSRLNASRPRASSPLASGSIVADPESPPTAPPPAKSTASTTVVPTVPSAEGFFPLSTSGSTTPAGKPPASLFGGFGSTPSTSSNLFGNVDGPKKTLGFGMGKPTSAPEAAPTGEKQANGDALSGAVPDFFGKKSEPNSGTSTPVPAPPSLFNFGATLAPAPVPVTAPTTNGTSGGFNFGTAPAKSTNEQPEGGEPSAKRTASFNYGAKPAETASASPSSFSFGAPKTDPKSTFSFGAPAATTGATDKAHEPKSTFSFGSNSTPAPSATETPKTDEPINAPFSFGQASGTSISAETPAEQRKKSSTFGASATKSNDTASKTSFNFGASMAPSSTAPASTFGGANNTSKATSSTSGSSSFGGFNFGKPAEAVKTTPTTVNGTTGTPAPAKSFSFGASSGSSAPAEPGFGSSKPVAGDAAKSSPFESKPPASSTPSFGFGSSSTSQANGTSTLAPAFGASATSSSAPSAGYQFGGPATSTPASNPFGTLTTPATPTTPAPGFSFGASNNKNASTSTPASNPFAPSASANPSPASSFNFTFGSQNGIPAGGSTTSSPFVFGGAGNTNPPPTTPTNPAPTFGGFGSTPSSATQTLFNFGPTAPSTTPQGAPPAFQFGAPAGGGSGMGGGVGQGGVGQGGMGPNGAAARFVSPAPSTPGGDGSGFSMGIAGAGDTPNSPSGRRIKPLRRSAVKR